MLKCTVLESDGLSLIHQCPHLHRDIVDRGSCIFIPGGQLQPTTHHIWIMVTVYLVSILFELVRVLNSYIFAEDRTHS